MLLYIFSTGGYYGYDYMYLFSIMSRLYRINLFGISYSLSLLYYFSSVALKSCRSGRRRNFVGASSPHSLPAFVSSKVP